jgi:cleavage and polyadenylation specificity factor subunit 3
VTTPPRSPHPHADPLSHDEQSDRERLTRLVWFLEAHFGEVELHDLERPDDDDNDDAPERDESGNNDHGPWLAVRLDDADARINLISMVRHKWQKTPQGDN